MSFQCLVYNIAAAGINASNSDMTAASDADFSQRNGHYVFTEHYRMFAAALVGASVTRGRFQVPTWNAIGEFVLFNANRALTPPSNAQYDMYGEQGPDVPMNEEFQVQTSNNLGAATEIENAALLLIPDDFSANLPPTSKKPPIITVRATCAITNVLNGWSGPQPLSFIQSLRGGVYSVVGAVCQGASGLAFRLVFPRTRMYHNRKLRPGWLVQTAIGDVISNQLDPWVIRMGEWGQFHTFEPVQLETFGTAAGAQTYQLYLWLAWMGESAPLYGQSFYG
jgi:hypothetical protein